MAGRLPPRALTVLVAATAVVAASCGGGGGSTTVTASPDGAAQEASGGPRSEPVRIRLALAPDPVWQWLKDSGTVMQWEAARNIRIEASSPFDQFSAFAGGHADVVVINALEVPQFVEQSDREPVIVGRFTTDRSFLAVRRTSRAETSTTSSRPASPSTAPSAPPCCGASSPTPCTTWSSGWTAPTSTWWWWSRPASPTW